MIIGRSNPLFKEIKSLSIKKYRERLGCFIIEGKKLLDEAIRSHSKIKYIITNEEIEIEGAIVFSNELFNELTYMIHSEGVLAVVEKEKCFGVNNKMLYLENINDPGNLGTILRSAEAFGFQSIMLSPDSCDVYNPKTVRSSMGSIFRLSIEYQPINILKSYEEHKKIAMSLEENSINLLTSKKSDKLILIIGNEHHGISMLIKSYVDEFVKIPMVGNTESLNASVAAAVSMFYYMM